MKGEKFEFDSQWIMPDGQKRRRHHIESSPIAEALHWFHHVRKERKEQKEIEE